MIQYKAGHSNRAADALLRKDHAEGAEIAAISVCKPAWLDAIRRSYQQDEAVQQRMTRMAVDPKCEPEFTLQDGVLLFRGRVWIGEDSTTQQHLIRALHASAAGGHSGFHATYNRVKCLFAWRGMKQQVKTMVRECMVCQQAKTERVSPAGLLQPLPIPQKPWSVVSLDFIEGLPRSGGYDTVLVVVNKFSKYAHFLPLAHPFTALQIAKVFLKEIY